MHYSTDMFCTPNCSLTSCVHQFVHFASLYSACVCTGTSGNAITSSFSPVPVLTVYTTQLAWCVCAHTKMHLKLNLGDDCVFPVHRMAGQH